MGSGLLVFTDKQPGVRQVHMRRHNQIIRRRFVLEYATGEVERGAVAGAKEATLPVIRERGLRTLLESVGRRATQVGTNAHHDRTSGLIERASLRAYSGVNSSGLRSDLGSASCESSAGKFARSSSVRRMIHTGLPRHSTVIFSPGLSDEMSASTAAPAALARSEGAKLLTNGDGCEGAADSTGTAGRDKPRPLAVVDWGVTHGNPQ